MKLLIPIIVGASILISGLSSAFGISLLRSKPQSINRVPYSFGDRYIYDNGGSSWNYNSVTKNRKSRFHLDSKRYKHRHGRFLYNQKRVGNEKLDGLLEHLTRNSSPRKTPYRYFRTTPYDNIGR